MATNSSNNRLPPPPVFHRPASRGTSSGGVVVGGGSSTSNTSSPRMAVRGSSTGSGLPISPSSSSMTMTTSSSRPEQDELTTKLEMLLMSPDDDDDDNDEDDNNKTSKKKTNNKNKFSVAKYLNLALSNESLMLSSSSKSYSSSIDIQQLQQGKMAELALQLQLESQKCHNTIEQIGMDINNVILPRCDTDIIRLKVGLDGLKQDTKHLYKESKPFVASHSTTTTTIVDGITDHNKNESTSQRDKMVVTTTSTSPVVNAQSPPLELLTTLHALKKNLTLTKSILSAASSWDATVSTIPALLSPPPATTEGGNKSGPGGTTSIANLMEAVQALSTLEHGARALRGLPGVEERDTILSAVRSKIEILLRPKLLHALQQSRSVNVVGGGGGGGGGGGSGGSSSNTNLAAALGALQQVANMYKLLGKTEMLQTEYVKARPAAIHRSWFGFKGSSNSSSSSSNATASSVTGGIAASVGGGRSKTSTFTTTKNKKKSKKYDDEAENYDINFDSEDDDDDDDEEDEDNDETGLVSAQSVISKQKQQQQQQQSQSFVTWTQEWYDSILILLSEERRRTMSVFGADMSREIIAKILAECFRPLLSSYSSRLETLFPSNETRLKPQQPSSTALMHINVGDNNEEQQYQLITPTSFAGVCAVYESTLRFLSMVYDANLQGLSIKVIKEIFVNVTQPYAQYQIHYATLEKYYCQYNYNIKYTSLLQEIKQTVGGSIDGNTTSTGRRLGSNSNDEDDNDDNNTTYALTNMLIDVSDRMSYLTIELFPIVEGCLGRYELLNCGYNASAAMETIDDIMLHYIQTLTNSVKSIISKRFTGSASNSTTDSSSSSNSLEENNEWMSKQFDEQHVQYAMEVLKSIGQMNQKLVYFQQRTTRERLKSLSSGMRASMNLNEDTTTDSLSLVEVAALLSREVLINANAGGSAISKSSTSSSGSGTMLSLSNRTNASTSGASTKPMTTASTIAQLQYLSGESRNRGGTTTSSPGNTPPQLPQLYPQSFVAMEQLAYAGQQFVFDIVSCVPRMWLRSVASMPVWRSGGDSALGSAISSFAGALGGGGGGGGDTYNKLPQQYITQVGEHVLALVQALEPFASNSESLILVKDVMNGLPYSVSSQPWNDLVSATGCGIHVEHDLNLMKLIMKGKVLKQHPWILLGNNVQHHGYYDEDDDDDNENETENTAVDDNNNHERDAELFCNEWLNVVCLAVTGRLLQGILRIARLSNNGRAHMEADLNYILNVFSAIGISGHPHPLLVHVLEIISMDDETLALRIDQLSTGTSVLITNDITSEGEDVSVRNDKISKLLKSIEQQLASMRGIGIH